MLEIKPKSAVTCNQMEVAAVTPVLGEFGYVVFEVQPRIRAWLESQPARRKVVFAPRELSRFFEDCATEIISPPTELLPDAAATLRSISYDCWAPNHPQRIKVERLVAWARATINADAWLDIPYFDPRPWRAAATYVRFDGFNVAPSEPYVVLAARARDFDSWRNWPKNNWDRLTQLIRDDWQVDVRCIGKPPSTYYPPNAIPQEVEEGGRLDHSISLLNGALCSISSNSGPTHLSLMTRCPTFAWAEPWLKPFMENHTNPLGTPCRIFPGGWDPSVEDVWTELSRWRHLLQCEGLWELKPNPKKQLSMCMIARDSSRTIGAAIESVRPWVDELIVVDTGSSDDTPQIAASLGANLFHFPWPDSFAAARNESIRRACCDWIFWMDSDDTISPEQGQKLRDLANAQHPPSTMGFVLQVHCPSQAQESGAYATPTVVDHVKMFRNIPALKFSGRIHEQILPAIRNLGCSVAWTDIYVKHSGSDQTAVGRARKHQRDLRLLELELDDSPDSQFALFNLGMTLLDMGRAEEALNSLSRSLQLSHRSESHVRKLWSLLVQAYSSLGRLETALRTCEQGLMDFPEDPELLFRRAMAEQRLGRLEDAAASYVTLLNVPNETRFSSRDQGIMGIKAWHNLAIVYTDLRRHDLAIEAWKNVLRHDATSPAAWQGLIDSFSTLGDREALSALKATDAYQHMPSSIRSLLESRLLQIGGLRLEALQVLQTAYDSARDVGILDEMCKLAFESGQLDLAVDCLTQLTSLRPNDASAFLNLATVHLKRHHYVKAAEYARRSLDLRPDYPSSIQVLNLAMHNIQAATMHA